MSAGTLEGTADLSGPAAHTRSSFRPEIQGLRGLAVVLVVIYHVWVDRVSGGVDVFLVLSGFFMVGQFARREAAGRRLDVVGYWRRTAGRIVPPAMVVLAGIVLASVVFLPQLRWAQNLQEALAATFFVENWRLAADAVDYYAANDTASVVQHFWSLSIQGQFYLVFPLVVLGVVLGARRLGRGVGSSLAGALITISATSLAYSVWLTATSQQVAYFDSLTRLWEFTLGGLLALSVERVTLPAAVRVVLGWLGVLGLISCGVVLDVAGGFPGYLALWPVTCAALIVVAGRTGSRYASDRILASRPARYVGDLSFSLYLWHWPVLVLALVVGDRTALGPLSGLLVIATSVLLAVATRHVVELPLRRRRDTGTRAWPDHRWAAVALATVAALLVGWTALFAVQAGEDVVAAEPDHPGATARMGGYVDTAQPDASLRPSAAALSEDWSQPVGPCRTGPSDPASTICDRVPPQRPTRHVMVVGDSHSQQLVPAVLPTADARGWEITTILKARCPLSLGPSPEPDCDRWNLEALDEIITARPDLVVVHGSRLSAGGSETTPPEFVAAWQELANVGIRVLAVRDSPRYEQSPTACQLDRYSDDASCATPRADAVQAVPSYATLPAVPSNVSFADFTDLYCLPDVCPPAIGNVLVYLDDNHVSASFARTMAPAFALEMDRALRR